MKLSSHQKSSFRAILSGSYTPHDLREFAQLCYLLARPHISKKVRIGKLNLSILGITENDAVHDCLADVFRRDAGGRFIEIETFFQREMGDTSAASTEQLLVQLRRLVLGKVNNNLVRLYSEADPALGKILRNIKLALNRRSGLLQVTRFNETCIAPEGIDILAHNPPFPYEALRTAASGVIMIHDAIPRMLAKLRSLLIEQDRYQRLVPLVWAGLVFKEIYTLGWEPAEEAVDLDAGVESGRLSVLVDKICAETELKLRDTYVLKGKFNEEMLRVYCCTLKRILNGSFADKHLDGSTFLEYLREDLPHVTRESYRKVHKSTLEYIVKLGKNRLQQELRVH